ncbi:MAG: HYR domain-containing protein [Saprospiraceae bacterium]|nr:HYR domain-containing protein [Saprospiraceae bacterium]
MPPPILNIDYTSGTAVSVSVNLFYPSNLFCTMFAFRVLFLTILFSSLALRVCAQAITFQKIYNDLSPVLYPKDMLETNDGYLIAGEAPFVDDGTIGSFLMRLDKQGEVLWMKTYGGIDVADYFVFSQIVPANDGGFIIGVKIQKTDSSPRDMGLLKVDDAGSILWQKTYGAPSFYEEQRGNIIALPDGYFLSGFKFNAGIAGSFFLRTENDGALRWSREVQASKQILASAQYASDSLVYLAGDFDRNGYLGVLNLNTGALVQTHTFPIDSLGIWYAAHPTADGNQLQAGVMVSKQSCPDLSVIAGWAQKTDLQGQVLWSKRYAIGDLSSFWSSVVLPDGSSVLTMFYDAAATAPTALVKIDPSGAVLWARSLGARVATTNEPLLHTSDGGFIVAGFAVASPDGQTPSGCYVTKTDSLGLVAGCCVANLPVEVRDLKATRKAAPLTTQAGGMLQALDPIPEYEAFPSSQDFCNSNLSIDLTQTHCLCAGETVTIGDSTYSQPGSITLTLPAENGNCTTSITHQIIRLNSPERSETISFCPGETVVLGDSAYSQPGTVVLTLPASGGGCDTLASYTLVHLPQPALQQTISFCPGETVVLGGTTYSQPGTVVLTLPASGSGCDTLATYTLVQLPQPALQQTIRFCPGETVVLGGTTYSQPGMIVLTLPASGGGCDTLATYTLKYQTENWASALQLTCPVDQLLVATSGAGAVCTYDTPLAVSDCPCPPLDLVRLSGGASGDLFPLGSSTVCYRAEDACGTAQTCCFNVKVEADEVCDSKTIGCFRAELLSVDRDAQRDWVYRVRLTNTCSDDLSFAYLEVPKGMQAVSPPGNSLYTAPSGNTYALRSPNFSPFHSLRFKPLAQGLANGQSDIFRFVLPAQASVDYLHVAMRLRSGAYTEAYLNTFFCPVGQEPAAVAERSSGSTGLAPGALTLSPNPTPAGMTLRIGGGDFSDGTLVLRDVTGRTLWEGPVVDNQATLPATVSGLCLFTVLRDGVLQGGGKIVVLGY